MFERKMKVSLSHDEKVIMIMALNELRNQLISEGRYTDPLDELLPYSTCC